jgi:hypothetical protein
MKTSLRVAVIILISSYALMAKDKVATKSKNIDFQKSQLQNIEPYLSTQQPPKVSAAPYLQDSNSLLKEINDSLLAIIKITEKRDREINKLMQHEQEMSPKQIMIDRLQLIGYMIKKSNENPKKGSK